MALLPPFESLTLDHIVEVVSAEDGKRAYADIVRHAVVGFDTESKPVFVRGHVSTGPHVAQFATPERAWVFLLHSEASCKTVRSILTLESVTKVGFGIRDDVKRIPIKLGVQPKNMLDLETMFAARGLGRGVGARVGVAMSLKRRLLKSRKTTTSNWMRPRLLPNQLLYAANDAYAAICVYHALQRTGDRGKQRSSRH